MFVVVVRSPSPAAAAAAVSPVSPAAVEGVCGALWGERGLWCFCMCPGAGETEEEVFAISPLSTSRRLTATPGCSSA
jgi:hypothetical protein